MREGSHVISEMERGKGFGLLAGSPTSLSGGYTGELAQVLRDELQALVRDAHALADLSKESRHLGVAFHAPPGSETSSRGEAKDSTLLSSRDKDLLEPPERPQRSPACSSVWREDS